MRTIYFDYNATTPLDPDVRAAMLPVLEEHWGNPSSVHHVGRKARALLDESRYRCSHVLGCKPSELIFTSGGTESVNLALFGAARMMRDRGRHLITSAVEHHAVLHSLQYLSRKEGFDLSVLPVDRYGRVDPTALKSAIRPDTVLVSIMAANNEIGTIQPVSELGAVCREKGVLFHCDAVQWLGKEPFDSIRQFNADMVSLCAHKFHGPKGAGALYVRSPLHPDPIVFGGGHENERRAGTEALHSIVGFTEALERFVRKPVFDTSHIRPLVSELRSHVEQIAGVQIVSPIDYCLANTLSFVVERSDSIALLAALDLEGFCASSGSACSAGSLEPSHVISALGFPPALANALVRFSLGRHSSMEEVHRVIALLPQVVRRSQLLDKRPVICE